MNAPLLSKETFNAFLAQVRRPLDLHPNDVQNALDLYPRTVPEKGPLRFSIYLGEALLSAFPKVRTYLRKYPAEARELSHKRLSGNLWAEFSSDDTGNTAWTFRADPYETGSLPLSLNGAFNCLPSLRYRGDPGAAIFLRDLSHSLGRGFTEDPFCFVRHEQEQPSLLPCQSSFNRLCYTVFKRREQSVNIPCNSARLLEQFVKTSVSGPFLAASIPVERSDFEQKRKGPALLVLEGYHDNEEGKVYFSLTLTGNARTDHRLASFSLPYNELDDQHFAQVASSLRSSLNEVYATRQAEKEDDENLATPRLA